MAGNDIQLIIDYENGNIKSVTSEAENEFDKSGKKSGRNFSKGFSLSIAGVGAQIAKIGAAAAAIGGIALFKSVKDAAQLEVITTQFEVMLKSASAARDQVAELQDFAASTPFQLPGLAEATTQLLSFGVAQKNIIPTLQQLGDLAAGVGVDITDLTIPFGRLAATQKLTLIELDKFADKGINIYKSLSEQTGISLKTIRDDISKGKIPYEEFTTALNGLTGESGLFFQGMEKKSKTLTGTLSTLSDNLFNLSANFGSAFSPIVIDGATRLISILQDINKEVTKSFDVFEDVIEPMLAFNEGFIAFVIAPMELLSNIGKVVFASLEFGLAEFVAKSASGVSLIAQSLEKIGLVSKSTADSLKVFAETSKQTAEEAAGGLGTALDNVLDFSLSDKLSVKNDELKTYFTEQRAIIAEEAAKTDEVVQAQAAKSAEQTTTFGNLLQETFNGVSIGINKTKEEMAKVAAQTANIVKNGLAKSVSGGIQNIVTSLAKGENVFENFGNFILSTLGDLAIQLGSFFIAEGIAVEAMNAVSGTGAIVAGAALVALGSLLKAATGGASAGASGGGGSTASPAFAEDRTPSGEFLDDRVSTTPNTIVNFNVDGNIKGDEEFIRGVVSDIGVEGGKQGLVFNNFATA